MEQVEKIEKPFISFNCFSSKIAFPFTTPFFYLIRDTGFKLLFSAKFQGHYLIIAFIMFMSEIFAGFGELIIHKNTSNTTTTNDLDLNNSQELQHAMSLNLIQKEKGNKLTKKFILLIITSAFIDLVCYNCISCVCTVGETEALNLQTEMRISPVFFMCILNYKFFNMLLYSHQKFSISIMAVGFLMLLVSDIIDRYSVPVDPKNPNALRTTIFYSFGILFVVNIAYSVKQIIDKLLMEKKFLSPFMLLFYQGCAGCSMCVILIIITSFLDCPVLHIYTGICKPNEKLEDVKGFFGGIQSLRIILGLLMIFVGGCFINIWLMLIKQFLTPTHRCISDALNAFCTWISLFITLKNTEDGPTYFIKKANTLIIDFVAYLLIVIGCLIYCEFVIINYRGMSEDTKHEIIKRGNQSNEDDLQRLVQLSILPKKDSQVMNELSEADDNKSESAI